MSNDNTQYLVAALGDAVIVSVRGRAVYTTCREFGEFLEKVGGSPDVRKLILDMKLCEGVDSTVLGLIAGAAGDFRGKGGEVVMQCCGPRIAEVVANLGLGSLLTLLSGDAVDAGTEKLLAEGATSCAAAAPATNRTILQAHETLMAADPDNVPRFKQVVDFMRADLGM